MIIRPAVPEDVSAISVMLYALKAAGKRTRRCDEEMARDHYVLDPHGILTSVAMEGGACLGLQILSRAYEGNPYGAPMGSGIIGTHVAPDAARRGIGRALFAATLEAAQAEGLTLIEAFIQKTNDEGHAYYGSMGFEPEREDGTALVRAFRVPAARD